VSEYLDEVSKLKFIEMARKSQVSDFSKIANFLKQNGVTSLFHFTHVSNLELILAKGLRTRSYLNSKASVFQATDPDRFDEFTESISFSISEPNRFLLPEKNSKFGQQLVLLEVSANTLLTRSFAAFPTNAASGMFKSKILDNPERYLGIRGLKGMYQNKRLRDEARLSKNLPTDTQSEILFFDSIPSSLIRKIHTSPNFSADSRSAFDSIKLGKRFPILEDPCQCGLFKRQAGIFRRYDVGWENNG
jgi:hypothetical protein